MLVELVDHLCGGWELSRELKIKAANGRIMAYLAFKRTAEASYDPDNIVAVDINEDNVTAAVFVGGVLEGFFRIETGLGRIAIAYSERRKRISQGRSISNRAVRKALKRLREGRGKRILFIR